MQTLKEVAHYVRSKNAGPFWVTIDVFCDTPAAYDRVRSAEALHPSGVASIFAIDPTSVKRFEVDQLNVLKISFPRPVAQGSTRDADSHAGQYFVALLELPIP